MAPERDVSTLVFIHGGGVGPWMWADQVAYFSRDHRVHTPTLPGHDLDDSTTFSTTDAAAHAVARQIGLDELPAPVTVVGFSLGGQVALQLAATWPERVHRLVVVSSLVEPWPFAGAISLGAGASSLLGKSRRFASLQARQLKIPAEQFDSYFALSRVLTATSVRRLILANLSFRVAAVVRDSRRPTLLMAGRDEPRAVRQGLARLTNSLQNCCLQTHLGASHGLPLQRPALFNRALAEWLDSTPGRQHAET